MLCNWEGVEMENWIMTFLKSWDADRYFFIMWYDLKIWFKVREIKITFVSQRRYISWM